MIGSRSIQNGCGVLAVMDHVAPTWAKCVLKIYNFIGGILLEPLIDCFSQFLVFVTYKCNDSQVAARKINHFRHPQSSENASSLCH